jgi:hypothetical protein
MQVIKLSVVLGGLLMAGQTLAHKAPHASISTVNAAQLTPAQTDTNPTALLAGVGGHGMQGLPTLPAATSQEAPPKTLQPVFRINRRH